MRISIFGLGYVGCVTAACLAKEGHEVVGVDLNDDKIQMINDGLSPVVEPGLVELMKEVRGRGRTGPGTLSATSDATAAVHDSDASLICVGTPSNDNGSLNVQHVKVCANEIGTAIRDMDNYHVTVVRSTMTPGTVDQVVVPEIESASGKQVGKDFGVAMNPEFLRESTSVEDFYAPPLTVIGQKDARSGDVVNEIYDFLTSPVIRTDIRSAEMLKYACNAFHALKVAFANEVGAICKSLDIDSHVVMNIFCQDHKLNISPYYCKPGFAFGGSCLPKDLRAITHKAKQLDIDVPVLNSILPSNRIHTERAIDSILRSGKRRIGILGLSFKSGTDDLRESPIVTVVEALIGKGLDIRIYDENVLLARLTGANKEYINKQIPHISSLMLNSASDVIDHGEIIVVCNRSPEFAKVIGSCDSDKLIFDLVRITEDRESSHKGYQGICW
ncbi:MAG: UDP-glucose/GDP-mannose dehydrogenase family protein [Lysobacterales bacterium]|nr:MAG: UDP-glucose/GDP-mannose dehydrogenase family protein [Xanthomonadales bacterium]